MLKDEHKCNSRTTNYNEEKEEGNEEKNNKMKVNKADNRALNTLF